MSHRKHDLEEILGYSFNSQTLLDRALTHSSAANERSTTTPEDNEQLEFLGDSIIGFFISDYLYQIFTSLSEVALSNIRAHLVSAAKLFNFAVPSQLGK